MIQIPDYKAGDIVEVKVVGILNYGAFCEIEYKDEKTNEIERIKGLIHISRISDFFVKNIQDFFKVGDIVEVEILSFNREKKQLELSYKSIRPALQNPNRRSNKRPVGKNQSEKSV